MRDEFAGKVAAMMENKKSEATRSNSTGTFKFTAVRLDLRHLTSSCRHVPRSQVFVISDRTSGLEVKRMVAEKNGLDEQLVVSRMDLIATVSLGDVKSELLVSDDRFLLDVYAVSSDHAVSFSLMWRKELNTSQANCVTSSGLHNVNQNGPVQDFQSELPTEQSGQKTNDRITYGIGSDIPGYKKTDNGETTVDQRKMVDLRTMVDQRTMVDPVRRLHPSKSSNSSWHSDRSRNECIIHYEPQNLSSKADSRSSDFHSAAVQEKFRSSTSSRPTSDYGSMKNPRTSKVFESGIVSFPELSSTASSSNDPQNDVNSSNGLLPSMGRMPRGEKNFLDEATSTNSSSSFSSQTFCPVVAAGRPTSGDAVQAGDVQREAKFSSLPNMDQMTDAQRCRRGRDGGAHQASVCQAAASSSSLPCISSSEGDLAGAGRRCLPHLCIPEDIVEEKRNLLSKRLEKKLQSAGRRKKQRRKRTTATTNHSNAAAGASRIANGVGVGGIDGGERKSRLSGEESDDCASMTSWEVAEILAMADPMAPQDSDYEDSPPSTDDDKVTSAAFKSSCRVTSSPSDADTLDGSSTESGDEGRQLAKEFSPIQCHTLSAQGVPRRLDIRSKQPGSENFHVATVKPVAVSNKPLSSTNQHTTSHNSVHLTKDPSKARSVNSLSLFRLLRNRNFRLRTSVLFRRSSKSAARGVDRLPFEIFNDVIHMNDVQSRHHVPKGVVREKFTVPVIGDSIDTSDWECLEGSIETGDIVVEVNGNLVLNRSSSEVIATCFQSSENLQFLLARQRRTQK